MTKKKKILYFVYPQSTQEFSRTCFKHVHAFLIKLEFRSAGFWGKGKPEFPGKKFLEKGRELATTELGEGVLFTQSHWFGFFFALGRVVLSEIVVSMPFILILIFPSSQDFNNSVLLQVFYFLFSLLSEPGNCLLKYLSQTPGELLLQLRAGAATLC